jgi:hypothetical protein
MFTLVLVLSHALSITNAFTSSGGVRSLWSSGGHRLQDSMLEMYTSQQSSAVTVSSSTPLYSSPAMAFGVGSLSPRDYSTDSESVPSFRMPKGLLSPQTVMRMEAWSSADDASESVLRFLDTYRSRGPMACLSYLSDPEVLPELTRAMRETSM